jgi:hypothetical protein
MLDVGELNGTDLHVATAVAPERGCNQAVEGTRCISI